MERARFYKIIFPIIIIIPIVIWWLCCYITTDPTTVFLVRHADRAGSSDAINATGEIRADELSRILDEADIDIIYASQFNRTQQTANPLATELGLTVLEYDAFDIPQLAEDITTTHKGKRILVVGHSNTVPQTIGALGFSPQPADIPEDEYDHLYIAILNAKINDQLIKMEYGADTP
ncbi:phosphoglycerate mutase family protein [Aureisphaera galaxeae]|uniref:SixA phosphatase family protein n=1 Tax=Aureisphaera galaxeae TaxID=1538023 RepID=UPI00234FC21C|nr:phosphoglycerate mutase family protein [Aureisphaera galaxeae]MDC8003915.1 phosphoglycerate mutase family protein [Aureisphaera galaxeae]